MLHLETNSSHDAIPVEINMQDDAQMAMTMQLPQQQQFNKATGSQSDSDTVIDGDGSQDDVRKHKLHQLTIEMNKWLKGQVSKCQ